MINMIARHFVETLLCTIRLDRKNGNLIGLKWKNSKVEIIREPRLGENFRLHLPPRSCAVVAAEQFKSR
ncbi:MAG: hypothetical protein HY360_08110 [Verrucomicrobia bacterium]|nr:hypothetical protein [Verrucomicrobiota bacterium]